MVRCFFNNPPSMRYLKHGESDSPLTWIRVNALSSIEFPEWKMKISTALAHICFPGGSNDKESARNAGDPGRTLDQEDRLEKGWRPTPVFLPGEFHE